jgi:SPP1 family predicted phage head-tail adaptor
MQAGNLRTKITILQASARRDGKGEFLAPSEIAVCWAEIAPISNMYADKQQQTVTEATWKIVIRYIDGITSGMIVQENGKTYNIEAVVDPDRKRQMLYLMCYLRNDGRTE